ncbi:MAG: tetratricopeptide repeat protein [Ignavibacterium sp.]|nr:tetratricopeptide repeat protein [Ignavibacterium sp.]
MIPPLSVSLKTKDGGFVYLDCRIYLPLIGMVILLAAILEKFNLKNKFNLLGLITVVLILSLFSFFKSKDYSNGERFWSSVTKEFPNSPYNWIGFGFYYYDKGQYLKAAQLAERAIELNPTVDPEFYHKAALAYKNAGQLNKANEHLKSALNLEKDKSITLIELIKNSLRLGNFSEAIKYLNQFKELEILDLKKKADLYSSLAYYFSYSGLMEYSVELMKQAIIYQPKNSTYLNDLGVFYYNTGKIDSAKRFFYEALKLDPLNEDFQRNVNGLKNLTQ